MKFNRQLVFQHLQGMGIMVLALQDMVIQKGRKQILNIV